MTREINIFTNFFKEKVYERTLTLNEQKDEILAQQYKIESQYRDLFLKNTELKEKKLLLALKNDEVQQSLRYAKRIQKAIQPTTKKFKESFSESFIYSKAKDIVSGDFCLVFSEVNKKIGEAENTIFLAADCTGHGVPGAIMSVLGINTLNKIIRELNYTDPGKIMDLLDKDINQVLAAGKKESDIVADGMELAVFSINKQTLLMKYSIARFTHFIIRNGKLIELFSYKSSIGYSFFTTQAKTFATNSFQLAEGDCLYVMSDGYADQFGGPLNTKYKRKNIKQLLLKINHLHMSEQKQILKKEFLVWKKSQQQVDDVLVIGIRF